MKKILAISMFMLLLSMVFPSYIWGQATLLHTENFDYAAGNLVGNGYWATISGTTNQIQVADGNLSYTGYMAPSGRLINLVSTNSEDVRDTLVTTNSGKVYSSFLMSVANSTGLGTTGAYFAHFSSSWTTFNARIWIRTSGSGFNLGISKTSTTSTIVWGSTVYNYATTYLVVHSYEFTAGVDNDPVKLWVNPVLTGGEPTPDATLSSGTDLTQLTAFNLREASGTANASIDGIRIGTSWAEMFPSTGTASIVVTPSALSGFNYLLGGGPSTSQSYTLSGNNLSPASGSIAVAGSTNYEVSTDNINFSSGFNVAYSGGALADTLIYVRLKSGLAAGIYNGESIGNSGGSAVTQDVTCSGAVNKLEPTNHVTSFAGVLGNPAYYYINSSWVDASSGVVPDGYLIKGSTVSFASIVDPIDGTPETSSGLVQNVNQGVQVYNFSGLYSGTTYYFKIYPYTNSSSFINYKIDGGVPQFSLPTANAPSLPLAENFEYTTGSNLTSNGWIAHSGAGTNPIQVNASPLTYSGYPASGVGKSVSLTTSGEDDNRAFNKVLTGSIYTSCLVNVASAQTGGDYFLHVAPENSTTLYYARVFVKKDATSSNIAFGIAKNVSASVVYTPFNYSLSTTYLIVARYDFNTAAAYDDSVKLWINPVLNGVEPVYDLIQTDTSASAPSLGMVALRQGSSTSAAGLTISGLRIATTWIPSSVRTLNLTALIQGFYDGSSMAPDTVTVVLHNTISPFAVVDSAKVVLNSSGSGSPLFYSAVDGVNYYIAIKHRNSLETWSANTPQFSAGTMNYNFTTAQAQTYGLNAVQVSTEWCIYNGDVNGDEFIDGSDVSDCFNDANIGASGYIVTDLTGDDFVDGTDVSIAFNNSNAGVGAFYPTKKSLPTKKISVSSQIEE